MIDILTDTDLIPSEKVVLMYLKTLENLEVTVSELCFACSVSKNTAIRAIQRLESLGRLRRSFRRDGQGHNRTEYILTESSPAFKVAEDVPTFVYIQRLESPMLCVFKVGVAINPEVRMKQQSGKSFFRHSLVQSRQFKNLREALSVETNILSSVEKFDCKKEWLPDGYTEVILESSIEKALSILNTFKGEQNEPKSQT